MAIELQLCPTHNRLFLHGACDQCTPTLPPGEAEEATREFEREIAASSEASARLTRVLELFAGEPAEGDEET